MLSVGFVQELQKLLKMKKIAPFLTFRFSFFTFKPWFFYLCPATEAS